MVFSCALGQLLHLLSIYLTFSMALHGTKSHRTKPKGQLNRLPQKQDEGILSTDIQPGAARTKSLPLGNRCVSGAANSWECNIENTNESNAERQGRVTTASLSVTSAPAHCLKQSCFCDLLSDIRSLSKWPRNFRAARRVTLQKSSLQSRWLSGFMPIKSTVQLSDPSLDDQAAESLWCWFRYLISCRWR